MAEIEATARIDGLEGQGALLLAGCLHGRGGPALLLDRTGRRTERVSLSVVGRLIGFQAGTSRHCIGYYNLSTRDFLPCPDHTVPAPDSKFCDGCKRRTNYFPNFELLDRDRLTPQQRTYLEAQHAVYLAYLGAGQVKVGISHAQRLGTRWTDQGALYATVIAVCGDAWEARRIEKRISRATSLPETVSSQKKLAALRFPNEIADGPARIAAARAAIRPLLNPLLGVQLKEDRIHDLMSYYCPQGLTPGSRIELPDDRPLAQMRCEGIVGQVLLGQMEGERVLLNLSRLVGRCLEHSDARCGGLAGLQSELF